MASKLALSTATDNLCNKSSQELGSKMHNLSRLPRSFVKENELQVEKHLRRLYTCNNMLFSTCTFFNLFTTYQVCVNSTSCLYFRLLLLPAPQRFIVLRAEAIAARALPRFDQRLDSFGQPDYSTVRESGYARQSRASINV